MEQIPIYDLYHPELKTELIERYECMPDQNEKIWVKSTVKMTIANLIKEIWDETQIGKFQLKTYEQIKAL